VKLKKKSNLKKNYIKPGYLVNPVNMGIRLEWPRRKEIKKKQAQRLILNQLNPERWNWKKKIILKKSNIEGSYLITNQKLNENVATPLKEK
jgi:hypothetical protein